MNPRAHTAPPRPGPRAGPGAPALLGGAASSGRPSVAPVGGVLMGLVTVPPTEGPYRRAGCR